MSEYSIIPSVLDDGTPAWALLRSLSIPPFFAGSKIIAKNTDKQVLETAIVHLQTVPGLQSSKDA